MRGVDRPDGETRFKVAYGNGPDRELRALLVCFLFLTYGWNEMYGLIMACRNTSTPRTAKYRYDTMVGIPRGNTG